jgi:hypothetical protein
VSPTYELPPGFAREFARMPREQRRAFQVAVTGETHVEWLRVGGHEILSRPQ